MTEPKPPANPAEQVGKIAELAKEAERLLRSAVDPADPASFERTIKRAREIGDDIERITDELEKQVAGVVKASDADVDC